MKKSFLALLATVAVLTTACEDKDMVQKLQHAEKTIEQLESTLKSAQSNSTELMTLKTENASLKEALSQAQKKSVLQVEIVKIFDKQDVIQHDKKDEEIIIEQSDIASFVSLPKTNLDWLNILLIKEANAVNNELETESEEFAVQDLKNRLEMRYQEMIEQAKADPVIGYEESVTSNYLGQRNHIATFTMNFFTYGGGAHGLHYTRYLNVDLDKQSLIHLKDLIALKNQEHLKEVLWTNYSRERLDNNGNYNGFAEKKNFNISDEFYFTPYGITFVYSPYELGPYAEGDIEIEASWYEINHLLNEDYQRKEKDGFYIRDIENQ